MPFIKIGLFILFFSIVIFRLIFLFEFFKKLEPINENCIRIRGALGIEDLVKYGKYLIGSSDDRIKLWESKKFGINTPNGRIVYMDSSLPNPQIHNLEMFDYPSDQAFHPHGIYLYKNRTLYVINHAYNKGGEKIDVFNIVDSKKSISLNYMRSIKLTYKFCGMLNDLVVVGDEDEIFFTTYLPLHDNEEKGREHNIIFKKLLSILSYAFNIKLTYIYYCKGLKGNCTKVEGTESLMNNGITYDGKNKIYAVNVLEKRIRIFKFNRSSKNKLEYLKDINVEFGLDNIEYDFDSGLIFAAFIGKVYNFLHYCEKVKEKGNNLAPDKIEYWGGSLSINPNNFEIKVLTLTNAKFYGISSSVKMNKYVYMGSWADDGLYMCEL